jgi:hypothetical protein
LRRLGQCLDGSSACFSRRPQREAASRYLDGLLNDSERKSMQAMHGRLSDPGQYQALQHFITDSPWDAERVWTQLRAAVPVRAGILAIDDTGFPKQGTDSVVFREKWKIALAQVRAILKAGFTITGVVVDADDGRNAAFREGLELLGLAYGVAIRGDLVFTVVDVDGGPLSAADLAASAPVDAWQTVTWGADPAQPIAARFCALRVRPVEGRGDRWLLCERSPTEVHKY